MHRTLTERLVCPSCHGDLSWKVREEDRVRVLEATAVCKDCHADYPVQEGIGIFLTPDLPRRDLWEQGNQKLSNWLCDHPTLASKLMDSPIEAVPPADLFFRSIIHEDRGEFAEAQRAFDLAYPSLYTEAYHKCDKAQRAFVVEGLRSGTGPVVDLASGRCYLAAQMASDLDRPIVATDFSPRVLRRDREWLLRQRLYDQVSLLAFDARQTPFKTGSVEALTTNLGLPNIENPGQLLEELRRIVSGRLLAISHFYPPDDSPNMSILRQYNLEDTMLRDRALAIFQAAGWRTTLRNACRGLARPTPTGQIIAGQGIDGMPVSETTLEWGVIEAW